MDIAIRFWNPKTNSVCARYFDSSFLGHATASDILESFKAALGDLPIGKLIQVSMDGPAVNWKFMESLSTFLDEDVSTHKLLNLGSCGLYVIQGALQIGRKASRWDINASLHAMYTLFKDSHARRAEYIALTGSTEYPKKFCQVRWVGNLN